MEDRERMQKCYIKQALKTNLNNSRGSFCILVGIGIYFKFSVERNEANLQKIDKLYNLNIKDKEIIEEIIFSENFKGEAVQ